MREYKFWDEVLAGVAFVVLFVFLAFL
jgi:hypothetical protein